MCLLTQTGDWEVREVTSKLKPEKQEGIEAKGSGGETVFQKETARVSYPCVTDLNQLQRTTGGLDTERCSKVFTETFVLYLEGTGETKDFFHKE